MSGAEWLHDAPGLLGWLRERGLGFGTGEALRASILLDWLTQQERTPDTPEQTLHWLAPVLCASPDEKMRLRTALIHYATTYTAEAPPPPPPIVKPAAPIGDLRTFQRAVNAARRGPWLWLLAALLVFGTIWLFRRFGSPAPVRPPPPPPGEYGGLNYLLAFLPNLAGVQFAILPWLAWCFFRRFYRPRPLALRRLQRREGARKSVPVRAGRNPLFAALELHRPVQEMRRHRLILVPEVDLRASIRATIRAAGRPVILPALRPRLPDYPILIEQLSGGDHVAALGRALVARLAAENVACISYTFESDPRACTAADGRRLALGDIATRHGGGDALLIVSDGDSMIDAISGRPRAWVTELTDRPYPVLLTPVPLRLWSRREHTLAEAGLVVLPATPAGLAALAPFLGRDAEPVQPALGWNSRRRGWLHTESRVNVRWHQDLPVPSPEEREEILDWLTADLSKPAFDLLCALALFPELRLDLTLHLGLSLLRSDKTPLLDEAVFGSIACLPWFRFGRMPSWLRRDLALCMSPGMIATTREIYDEWLVTSLEAAAGSRLEITTAQRRLIPGWLRQTARSSPTSPIRDVLFLTFMERKPLSAIDFVLPDPYRRLLRPDWLDPRRIGLALAALSSVALVWFNEPLLQLARWMPYDQNEIYRYIATAFSWIAVILWLWRERALSQTGRVQARDFLKEPLLYAYAGIFMSIIENANHQKEMYETADIPAYIGVLILSMNDRKIFTTLLQSKKNFMYILPFMMILPSGLAIFAHTFERFSYSAVAQFYLNFTIIFLTSSFIFCAASYKSSLHNPLFLSAITCLSVISCTAVYLVSYTVTIPFYIFFGITHLSLLFLGLIPGVYVLLFPLFYSSGCVRRMTTLVGVLSALQLLATVLERHNDAFSITKLIPFLPLYLLLAMVQVATSDSPRRFRSMIRTKRMNLAIIVIYLALCAVLAAIAIILKPGASIPVHIFQNLNLRMAAPDVVFANFDVVLVVSAELLVLPLFYGLHHITSAEYLLGRRARGRTRIATAAAKRRELDPENQTSPTPKSADGAGVGHEADTAKAH